MIGSGTATVVFLVVVFYGFFIALGLAAYLFDRWRKNRA